MESLFKALADPSRRKLLDSLHANPGQSLSELEAQLDMSRFGVMKHLGVLEEAHLVIAKKQGRFKYHYLNALPLQDAIDRWMEPLLQKPVARAVTDLKSKLEGPPTMPKPDFMMETYIHCTREALWQALTDPGQMGTYHFLSDRVELTDDTYVYYRPDGAVMLKTKTLLMEPQTRIEATFEPHWDANIPVSKQVFLLVREGDYMKLTIEHYDVAVPVIPGEGVADGWVRWAAGLKSWLETGAAPRFTPVAETA